MRTHRFFTKEAIASAITYSEILRRNKNEEYQLLTFPFDCTPAEPLNASTTEVIYKAGDDPKKGLLRFGRQELILPGSRFHFAMWGNIPFLEIGQMFLIGKKRAAALITECQVEDDVQPDFNSKAPIVLPVQVSLSDIGRLPAYRPIAATARYFIVEIPIHPGMSRLKVGSCLVPLLGWGDRKWTA
jgi:hypothetical protein